MGGVRKSDAEIIRNVGASISTVVPAKAGTHNPREQFGKDWSLGTITNRNR